MTTAEQLRENAREYEEEIRSKLKPTQVTKLQQSLEVKGNSPLLHIEGFNPVEGRGLDAQHQLLGPVKETFKKSFTPAFNVKSPTYSQLHFSSSTKSNTLSTVRVQTNLKEINKRIFSIQYPPDHARISRPIQNIADFIGTFPFLWKFSGQL
jgi:hypothetical protein